MRYLLAADFHGNIGAYKELKRVADSVKPDEIILLGDLFDGAGVVAVNNELDKIFYPIMAVEGNCDLKYLHGAELNAGSGGTGFLREDKRRAYFTHGHLYGRGNIPAVLGEGDVLFFGHYHFPEITLVKGVYCVCVGSTGRPRAGSDPTYCLYDGEKIVIKNLFSDEIIVETTL